MVESPLKLIRKFSIFTVGPIISAFIGFLIVPITTWFVSPEEFGKASLYTVVISITSLVSILGLDSAFLREFYPEKNKVKLLQNSVIIPLFISFSIATIIILNLSFFSNLVFGEVSQISMLFISLVIVSQVIHKFNIMIVRSLEMGWTYSLILILEKVLNAVLLLTLLNLYEKSFTSIVLSQAIALISATIVLTVINRSYWFHRWKLDFEIIKKTLKYGVPLAPALMMTLMLTSVDIVFLRTFSDFSEVGIYSVAFKIVGVLAILQSAFATFWTPTSLKWYESGVSNRNFSRVGHLVTTLCMLSFAALVTFRDWIVLILDSDYLTAAAVIPFLLFAPISEIIMQVSGKGIAFSRKTYYHLMSSGIAFIANIVLNYLLIPHYGALGAAIATGFSFLILFFVRTIISRKLWYDFDLKYYFLSIFLMLTMALFAVILDSLVFDLVMLFIIILVSRKDLQYFSILFKKALSKVKRDLRL